MTNEQLLQIKNSVEETIKVTVNGKIDRLTTLMNDHNEKHEEDMKEVRNHMKEVAPILESYETLTETVKGTTKVGKVFVGIALFITSISAAYLTVKGLFVTK